MLRGAEKVDLVAGSKDRIGLDNPSTATAVLLRHRYELGEESEDWATGAYSLYVTKHNRTLDKA